MNNLNIVKAHKNLLLLISILTFTACGKDESTFTLKGKAKIPSNTSASFFLKATHSLADLFQFMSTAFAVPSSPTGSPAAVNATVYSVYLSTSTSCINPVKVLDNGTSGQVVDLTQSPTLFTGAPDNGTYPCIIVELNDILPFIPDATAVAAWPTYCVAGTTYFPDTYASGEGAWNDINGNAIPATGTVGAPVANHQFNFFSTVPAAAIGAGTAKPVAAQIQTLSNALVIPGNSTFFIDLRNSIDNTHSTCWPNPVGIGFE